MLPQPNFVITLHSRNSNSPNKLDATKIFNFPYATIDSRATSESNEIKWSTEKHFPTNTTHLRKTKSDSCSWVSLERGSLLFCEFCECRVVSSVTIFVFMRILNEFSSLDSMLCEFVRGEDFRSLRLLSYLKIRPNISLTMHAKSWKQKRIWNRKNMKELPVNLVKWSRKCRRSCDFCFPNFYDSRFFGRLSATHCGILSKNLIHETTHLQHQQIHYFCAIRNHVKIHCIVASDTHGNVSNLSRS